VLDEVSLIGSRIFSFIDLCLRSIKHAHNLIVGNMDVIITSDLYQTPLVQDKWVFQRTLDNIDALRINFWLDCFYCFEFFQFMHQSDERFIEVLNRIQITTHNPINITVFNNICLCQPPNELDFPSMY
jgi:hypothetical protein